MARSDSDSENECRAEKKVKERKEKKKKDKFVDVSDHAETQLQTVKGARKKRKTKDSETPVEAEPAEPISSNPEGEGRKKRKRDREGEEPPSDNTKEKKKRKKEKTLTTAYDPTTDSPLRVSDAPGAGTVTVVPEIPEKKRKKNNPLTILLPLSSSPYLALMLTSRKNRGGGNSRKATLSMPMVAKGHCKNRGPRPRNGGRGKPLRTKNTHPPLSPRMIIPLGSERNPKRPFTQTPLTIQTSQSNRRKVRTPSPLSRSPGIPIVRSTVTALIYIYSQFTSPETWKFNKARQNWIIRNVLTSKVPEKHVPMVVEHLSKVQGRARETLVESCNKVISGSNPGPPTTQAGTDEKGSSENPKPPTTTITRDEITQRAYTLLYALTKKS